MGFENKEVKALISNIGGNDSIRLLPFLDVKTAADNPKIFIGYSDVLTIHLFCRKAGLSTFYGHNLLPIIAENLSFHPYSQKWFDKVLLHNDPIGVIAPSDTYSCDDTDYADQAAGKTYHRDGGYLWLQGQGKARGRLFGGHTSLMDTSGTPIEITAEDFKNTLLFIEDIPEFFSPEQLADFIDWLGNIGALQTLKGILIGKLCGYAPFEAHKDALLRILNDKYGLIHMPVVANMNFGHTSPMCILPYGAMAEIDCGNKTFSILESAVV